MLKITIIIPCYNEAKSIPELINKLSSMNNHFKFVVLDNGSTDNSLQVLREIKLPP